MALSFGCQLASAVCLILACQGFAMPSEAWLLADNAWAWNPTYRCVLTLCLRVAVLLHNHATVVSSIILEVQASVVAFTYKGSM